MALNLLRCCHASLQVCKASDDLDLAACLPSLHLLHTLPVPSHTFYPTPCRCARPAGTWIWRRARWRRGWRRAGRGRAPARGGAAGTGVRGSSMGEVSGQDVEKSHTCRKRRSKLGTDRYRLQALLLFPMHLSFTCIALPVVRWACCPAPLHPVHPWVHVGQSLLPPAPAP